MDSCAEFKINKMLIIAGFGNEDARINSYEWEELLIKQITSTKQ